MAREDTQMRRRRQALRVAGLVSVLLLAGCAKTTVQPERETSIANLPAPSIVLVHKLSVNLQEVTDTQGLYGKAVDAVEQESASEATKQLAQEVSNTFADEL